MNAALFSLPPFNLSPEHRASITDGVAAVAKHRDALSRAIDDLAKGPERIGELESEIRRLLRSNGDAATDARKISDARAEIELLQRREQAPEDLPEFEGLKQSLSWLADEFLEITVPWFEQFEKQLASEMAPLFCGDAGAAFHELRGFHGRPGLPLRRALLLFAITYPRGWKSASVPSTLFTHSDQAVLRSREILSGGNPFAGLLISPQGCA